MSRRFASLLLALSLAAALAACAAAPSAAPASAPSSPNPTSSPAATPAPTPAATLVATPAATSTPDTGNVDGPGTPDFSVEPSGAQTIKITLTAPDAKAWRIAVAGTGDHAADRWDLTVETGDVAPVITTTEAPGGVAAEPVEQPKLELGTAKGKICSTTLPVCLVASSLSLPADGDGTIVLDLVRTDAGAALSVTAATAAWDGDPFVLGAWTTTEAFPWGV
jgi:hypothetical protein